MIPKLETCVDAVERSSLIPASTLASSTVRAAVAVAVAGRLMGRLDWPDAWTLNTDMSNAFEFDEQVHAAYGVLSQGVGKLELQGGLRAERASRDDEVDSGAKLAPNGFVDRLPVGVLSGERGLGGNGRTTVAVNFREGPSLSSRVIAVLPAGTPIFIKP